MSFVMILVIISLILDIYAIFFESHKKDKKSEYFFNFIILLAISVVLFAMAMPSSFHGYNNSGKILRNCYHNQNALSSAIERYNSDNENQFPINCDFSEVEKYQNELLVKNNYLKQPVNQPKHCTFIVKDSEVFCLQHGSFDPNSTYFTDGSFVKGYENYDGQNNSKRKLLTELNSKERERKIFIASGIAGLIAALKFFTYIFI